MKKAGDISPGLLLYDWLPGLLIDELNAEIRAQRFGDLVAEFESMAELEYFLRGIAVNS